MLTIQSRVTRLYNDDNNFITDLGLSFKIKKDDIIFFKNKIKEGDLIEITYIFDKIKILSHNEYVNFKLIDETKLIKGSFEKFLYKNKKSYIVIKEETHKERREYEIKNKDFYFYICKEDKDYDYIDYNYYYLRQRREFKKDKIIWFSLDDNNIVDKINFKCKNFHNIYWFRGVDIKSFKKSELTKRRVDLVKKLCAEIGFDTEEWKYDKKAYLEKDDNIIRLVMIYLKYDEKGEVQNLITDKYLINDW